MEATLPTERLRQFFFWDAIVCLLSVALLLGVYSFYPSVFLVVMMSRYWATPVCSSGPGIDQAAAT